MASHLNSEANQSNGSQDLKFPFSLSRYDMVAKLGWIESDWFRTWLELARQN